MNAVQMNRLVLFACGGLFTPFFCYFYLVFFGGGVSFSVNSYYYILFVLVFIYFLLFFLVVTLFVRNAGRIFIGLSCFFLGFATSVMLSIAARAVG
ncbi:hypothetical protein [Pseudomonas anguilliseptica]|uniref:hypothetical protein n=1 Tax=Pseudomonas anguilliseptica TaxID=53406 RepID=UPI0037370868